MDRKYLELAKAYQRLRDLSEDKTRQELYLSNCVFAIVLAPYGNEQHDLLHRLLANEKKLLESLPVFRELLVLLTTWELIEWPLPKQLSNSLSQFTFDGISEPDQNFDQLLRDRIVEHVCGYFCPDFVCCLCCYCYCCFMILINNKQTNKQTRIFVYVQNIIIVYLVKD